MCCFLAPWGDNNLPFALHQRLAVVLVGLIQVGHQLVLLLLQHVHRLDEELLQAFRIADLRHVHRLEVPVERVVDARQLADIAVGASLQLRQPHPLILRRVGQRQDARAQLVESQVTHLTQRRGTLGAVQLQNTVRVGVAKSLPSPMNVRAAALAIVHHFVVTGRRNAAVDGEAVAAQLVVAVKAELNGVVPIAEGAGCGEGRRGGRLQAVRQVVEEEAALEAGGPLRPGQAGVRALHHLLADGAREAGALQLAAVGDVVTEALLAEAVQAGDGLGAAVRL